MVMTLPDGLICKVPLTATAPLLTRVDPVIRDPLTRSSLAVEVLLTVKNAGDTAVKDLAVAISAWPDPVGAIVKATWLGLAKPVLSMVCRLLPLITTALDVPLPVLVIVPPVWVKLPFTFKVLLPEAPDPQKSMVPPLMVTLPLTVIVGEPVPAVKINLLLDPERERLPETVNDEEVLVPKRSSRFWVFDIVRLPLMVVRLPLKLRSAPGSAVRLMMRWP